MMITICKYLSILPLVVSFVYGCGYENTVCEKTYKLQREFCEGHEQCLQCGCVTQGYFCAVEWEKLGYRQIGGIRIPDFQGSGVPCDKKSSCSENVEEFAKNCAENKDMGSCTPWIYYEPLELFLCEANMGFDTVYCEW